MQEARGAWAAIAKPVTEETFIAWYCRTHHKKQVGWLTSYEAEAIPRLAGNDPSRIPTAGWPPTHGARQAGGRVTYQLRAPIAVCVWERGGEGVGSVDAHLQPNPPPAL